MAEKVGLQVEVETAQAKQSLQELRQILKLMKEEASQITDPKALKSFNNEIQSLEKEIKQLSNAGKAGFDEMGNAIGKSTNYAGKAFGALRNIANILPGIGLAGLLAFAIDPIVDFVKWLFKASDATEFLAESQKRLDGFNKDVAVSVAKESAELLILKAKIEDTKLPMDTRIANVKDLQLLYPQYFKDLKQEDILNGNAAIAYNLAAQAILRKAKAMSASKKVEELALSELDIDKQAADDKAKTDKAIAAAVKKTKVIGKAEIEVVTATKEEVQKQLLDDFNKRDAIRENTRKAIVKDQEFYVSTIKDNTDITKEQREKKEKEDRQAENKAEAMEKKAANKARQAAEKAQRESEARAKKAKELQDKLNDDLAKANKTAREKDLLDLEQKFEDYKKILIAGGFSTVSAEEFYLAKRKEVVEKYDDANKKKFDEDLAKRIENERKKNEKLLDEEKRHLKEKEELGKSQGKDLSLNTKDLLKNDGFTEDEKKATLQATLDYINSDLGLQQYGADERTRLARETSEAIMSIDEKEKDHKLKMQSAVASGLNAVSEIVGQNTVVGKALAVSASLISTYSAIAGQLAAFSKIPIPGYAIAQAFATGLVGLNAVKNILKVKVPGKGGGIGSISSPSLPQAAAPPQAVSNVTTLDKDAINALGNQALRAYVVENDITNSQGRIQRIKRSAILG